jgi:energy-coupling factor transporter ATP-binding protein EcfA2
MEKTVIAILGQGDSGKSTIIRSLTGVYSERELGYRYNIEGEPKPINAYIITVAPPEEHRKKEPRDFRSIIDKCYDLIVIPLRIKGRNNAYKFPEYLELFVNAGCKVYTFVINQPYKAEKTSNRCTYNDEDIQEIYEKVFGLTGKTPEPINSNILPLLNAKMIYDKVFG